MKIVVVCVVLFASMNCVGATESVPDVLVQGKVMAKIPSLKELKDKFVGIVEQMYVNKDPGYVFAKESIYRRGSVLGRLHPDKNGSDGYFFHKWSELMQSLETPEVFTKEEALAWIEKSAGGPSVGGLGGGLNDVIHTRTANAYAEGSYFWLLPHLNLRVMESLDREDVDEGSDPEYLHFLKQARVLTRRIHHKIKTEGMQNLWVISAEKALDTLKELSEDIVVTGEELDLPLVSVSEFQQDQDEFSERDLICRGGGVLGMSINGFYNGYCGTFSLECLANMLVGRNPRCEDEPYDEFECAADMARYARKLVKERRDSAKELTEDEALEYFGTLLADCYTKEWAAKPQKPVSDRFATPESIFLNVPLKKLLALHNEPHEHSTPTDDILSTSTESPKSLRDDVAADEPAVAHVPTLQNLVKIPAPAAILAPDRDQDMTGAGLANTVSVVPESLQELSRKKKRQRKMQKQNHVVESEPIVESEPVVEPVVKALTPPPPVVRPVMPVAPVVPKKTPKQKRPRIVVEPSMTVVPLEQSALVASPVLEPVVQVVCKTPLPVLDRPATPVFTPIVAESASPASRASTPSEHRAVAALPDAPAAPTITSPVSPANIVPKKSNAAKGFIAAGLASGALFYYVRKKEAEISRELLAVENNPKSSWEAITKLREQQRWLRRYKLLTLIPFLGGLGIGVVKSARG